MSDNPCTFPCCGCTSNRACEMLTTATAKTGIVPSGQPLADTITQLRADLAEATGKIDRYATEIQRLRKALNQIAWPGAMGINVEQTTTDMYRHIAIDALAIGKASL